MFGTPSPAGKGENHIARLPWAYIEGSLRARKWQDKNTGQDRYATEVFVSEMQMLD